MKPRLIVIVGETATGKTELAIELARRFNGEIICADSATVRRELDIGTAKPSTAERAMAPHHLLNVAEPCERFTVAQFKQLATEAIEDIANRGKVPVMAGGSGLYVDSVIYDYGFAASRSTLDREKMRQDTLVVGLKIERELLKARIAERVDKQLAAGLEAEVKALAESYGWQCPALRNIAYAQWREYFEGAEALADTRHKIIRANLDFAKRQRTWFKRNKSIHWFITPVNLTEAEDVVTTFLST